MIRAYCNQNRTSTVKVAKAFGAIGKIFPASVEDVLVRVVKRLAHKPIAICH